MILVRGLKAFSDLLDTSTYRYMPTYIHIINNKQSENNSKNFSQIIADMHKLSKYRRLNLWCNTQSLTRKSDKTITGIIHSLDENIETGQKDT